MYSKDVKTFHLLPLSLWYWCCHQTYNQNHCCIQPSLYTAITVYNHHCIQPLWYTTITEYNHHCLQPSLYTTTAVYNHHWTQPSLYTTITVYNHHCIQPSLYCTTSLPYLHANVLGWLHFQTYWDSYTKYNSLVMHVDYWQPTVSIATLFSMLASRLLH